MALTWGGQAVILARTGREGVNKAKGQIWILIGEIKLRGGLREFWGFLSLAAKGFCKLHLDHSPGLGDGDFVDWDIGTTALQKVPEDFNTKPCQKEKKKKIKMATFIGKGEVKEVRCLSTSSEVRKVQGRGMWEREPCKHKHTLERGSPSALKEE